eukprot:6215968-Pyramimonas_sp.AAC.1
MLDSARGCRRSLESKLEAGWCASFSSFAKQVLCRVCGPVTRDLPCRTAPSLAPLASVRRTAWAPWAKPI